MSLILLCFFINCGADEANVSSQSFLDDFGEYTLRFNLNGCNATISVTTYTNKFFITEHGVMTELHGMDREVIKDVGIRYETENFTLTKYFDQRIVYEYFDERCQITTFGAN